jgi:hypothetical protein
MQQCLDSPAAAPDRALKRFATSVALRRTGRIAHLLSHHAETALRYCH